LQGCDILARRLQLIEEAHRISPSAPDYSMSDHFMGWGGMQHGAVVAPKLREHVAANDRGDAAVAKEARKAREEAGQKRGKLQNAKKGEKTED
jgi:hypothetical protein